MEKDVVFDMPKGKKMKFNTEEGIVKHADLSRPEDRPFLTLWIGVDFGGSFQGAFGGMVLGGIDEKDAETSKSTLDIVRRVTNLFEVETLPEIIGKKVTVIRRGFNDNIIGLQSEDGFTFFPDHWRVDHFRKEMEPNSDKIEANVPIRNERSQTRSSIGARNRLEDIE